MPSVPVTMAAVARAAGVSKNTVSLALRNSPQIPERTRRRITGIAARLKYRKNATVAHLMAEMRRTRGARHQAGLALLNAHADRDAFRTHPTIPVYVAGCRQRASALGYSLDEFWLHDPALDGPRLNAILHARGIRGAVAVGLMRENRLPERFAETWRDFPVVVTGVRTESPALSFACTDHHMLVRDAFRQALALGCRRPGLVIDPVIDRLVDGRFSAGLHAAQQDVARARRVRTFFAEGETRADEARFAQWLGAEKPDAILTLYNVVRRWLARLRVSVPGEMALIQLEWRRESPEWSGMNQHNDVVGAAAVEMVIGMIHNQEFGPPEFPRATLVGSTWMEGTTATARAAEESGIGERG